MTYHVDKQHASQLKCISGYIPALAAAAKTPKATARATENGEAGNPAPLDLAITLGLHQNDRSHSTSRQVRGGKAGQLATIADGDAETNGDADDENDDEDECDGEAVSGGFQFGVCICGWSASRGRISGR